jgi:hypothetical protein
MRPLPKNLLVIVTAVPAAACSHVQPTASASALAAKPEHVVQTNFSVGQTKQALVGETMISVKDYYRKPAQHDVWSIATPVKVEAGLFPITVVPGEYRVKGREQLDGVTYDAIAAKVHLTELSTMSPSSKTVEQTVLIAPDGGIRGAANAWGSSKTSATVGIRAVKRSSNAVDTSHDHTNYELIYSGLSGGTLHIAYREHGTDDAAHTAFSQDLAYDLAKSPIRFRKLAIAVDKATNDSITFRVVSTGDGTPALAANAAVQP